MMLSFWLTLFINSTYLIRWKRVQTSQVFTGSKRYVFLHGKRKHQRNWSWQINVYQDSIIHAKKYGRNDFFTVWFFTTFWLRFLSKTIFKIKLKLEPLKCYNIFFSRGRLVTPKGATLKLFSMPLQYLE